MCVCLCVCIFVLAMPWQESLDSEKSRPFAVQNCRALCCNSDAVAHDVKIQSKLLRSALRE